MCAGAELRLLETRRSKPVQGEVPLPGQHPPDLPQISAQLVVMLNKAYLTSAAVHIDLAVDVAPHSAGRCPKEGTADKSRVKQQQTGLCDCAALRCMNVPACARRCAGGIR